MGQYLSPQVHDTAILTMAHQNAYHCEVNEEKMMQAATNLVSKGFKDAGYIYINNDDCWSNHNGRDNTTHQLLPNMTKYPDGIDGLAKKVHDMGLKFGIYSSAGTLTCGGYPGSLGYEDVDAETFAKWGVDYLKYDNCYVSAVPQVSSRWKKGLILVM